MFSTLVILVREVRITKIKKQKIVFIKINIQINFIMILSSDILYMHKPKFKISLKAMRK